MSHHTQETSNFAWVTSTLTLKGGKNKESGAKREQKQRGRRNVRKLVTLSSAASATVTAVGVAGGDSQWGRVARAHCGPSGPGINQ